jgi:choline dehydrogenase
VGDSSKSTNSSFETHDPAAYADGPLQIGFQGYVPDSGVAFIEACTAVNIPIVTELNTGNGVGVKQGSGTIDSNFMRSSSYDSYYMRAKNRPNLHVLARSPVVKVVFSGTTATGVVYIDEPTGKYFNATANKEVIMAGGAFHTPQILMVSVSLHFRTVLVTLGY